MEYVTEGQVWEMGESGEGRTHDVAGKTIKSELVWKRFSLKED
jgi:hypothetical protein